MLIEQSTCANRWQRVSPVAEGIFALGGFRAAFAAAGSALVALAVGWCS